MTKQKLNSSFVKDAAEIVRQVQQAAFDEGWVSTDRALTHDLCIISDLSRNLTYKLENLAAKLKQNEIETLKQEQASAGDSPRFAVGDTVRYDGMCPYFVMSKYENTPLKIVALRDKYDGVAEVPCAECTTEFGDASDFNTIPLANLTLIAKGQA